MSARKVNVEYKMTVGCAITIEIPKSVPKSQWKQYAKKQFERMSKLDITKIFEYSCIKAEEQR